MDALIGFTGFVGSTLLAQRPFDATYRSTSIRAIEGRRFDTVVCAGAPGQKWRANRDPEEDRASLASLTAALGKVECERFVLISTVDVFRDPVGVDESTEVDERDLQPYGLHRRQLERFVQERFARPLVLRLPALVGPGLRKNAIHDLHNRHRIEAIDGRGVFQFYPTSRLWQDLTTALAAGLPLVHLTAAPIAIATIAATVFGVRLERTGTGPVPRYDMRTLHAAVFGATGHYQVDEEASMAAVREYARTEPRQSGGGA